MKEADVERHLHSQIILLGGTTRKWVSPSHVGVPDRIVLLPGGRILFVEVKTDHGKLSSPQAREIERLRELGCDVRIAYGFGGVDYIIRELRHAVR